MIFSEPPPDGASDEELQAWADRRAQLQRFKEQHEMLWWALGWLPTTLKNRVAIFSAVFAGLMIGGQGFIDNIIAFLQGLMP